MTKCLPKLVIGVRMTSYLGILDKAWILSAYKIQTNHLAHMCSQSCWRSRRSKVIPFPTASNTFLWFVQYIVCLSFCCCSCYSTLLLLSVLLLSFLLQLSLSYYYLCYHYLNCCICLCAIIIFSAATFPVLFLNFSAATVSVLLLYFLLQLLLCYHYLYYCNCLCCNLSKHFLSVSDCVAQVPGEGEVAGHVRGGPPSCHCKSS